MDTRTLQRCHPQGWISVKANSYCRQDRSPRWRCAAYSCRRTRTVLAVRRDRTRHLSDEQRKFARPHRIVAGGKEVTVVPVNEKNLPGAVASLAAAYSADPLIAACMQEVRHACRQKIPFLYFYLHAFYRKLEPPRHREPKRGLRVLSCRPWCGLRVVA